MLKKVLCIGLAAALLWLPFPTSAAPSPEALSSVSAVIYEPRTGRVLYEKDAHRKRPMASTTKLMTALVAMDILAPDTVVVVPEAAVYVEGSSMGLRSGDMLTVRDLLTGMLLSSGNDAANAVALLCSGSLVDFAQLMNQKAAQLGMTHSVFVTPSGLDEGEHGASAYDMALLGAAVLQCDELAAICALKSATVTISGRAVTLTNHNRLLSLYEPTVGLKTGFTKKSGRCLVSAARQNGVTLVVVTLNGGDYWNDHMALYDYGFSVTETVSPTVPTLPELSIIGGVRDRVALSVEQPDTLVLRKGEASQVVCTAVYPPYVWAPIGAGDTVGMVRYTLNGQLLAEVPITVQTAVAQRPPWSFMKKWRHRLMVLSGALLR